MTAITKVLPEINSMITRASADSKGLAGAEAFSSIRCLR